MKISSKAVLLSVFVFPGAGHIFLKKYIPGAILVGISFSGIYYLTLAILAMTLQIQEKVQSGGVQLNIATITELASKLSVGTEAQQINIATSVILICWVIGIFDSYRIGYMREKNEKT